VVEAEDRYNRLVATVWIHGSNANLEQVRRGMAWVYVDYPHSDEMLNAEHQARASHRGLWSQANPLPPWQWRRQQKGGNDWEWLLNLIRTEKNPAVVQSVPPAMTFSCGNKLSCNQMNSCEEARFYLTRCSLGKLDGDHDGTPCETLCR